MAACYRRSYGSLICSVAIPGLFIIYALRLDAALTAETIVLHVCDVCVGLHRAGDQHRHDLLW
jgi:hypothetical protein